MYLTCRSAKRSIIRLLPLFKVVRMNASDSCNLYNFTPNSIVMTNE